MNIIHTIYYNYFFVFVENSLNLVILDKNIDQYHSLLFLVLHQLIYFL